MKAVMDGPPPPVMKTPVSRRARPLTVRPPEGDLKGLADTFVARQSIRTYSNEPLPRRQFEQFLQLTARAYASIEHPVDGPTSRRNYPSGGAKYPLEIYPVVLNVESFARGFYYYHPFHHQLEFLGRKSRYLEALRQVVRMRMARRDNDRSEPAVLFLVTAVFPRTCWKYSGIPLPLILQETGALYQTMYLAATAMSLAPCAVGAFPERAVGEILGLDPADEAQVGLFALGVRAEPPTAEAPLTIERFTVRRGSPLSGDPSRYSIELVFAGGLKETIDARDFRLTRSVRTLTCVVNGGRRRAVFAGKAASAIRQLLSERRGVVRCRLGRESVTVETTST
jgi:SagB-type dehydrogenase family enzyme